MEDLTKQSYYEILEVSPDAAQTEIIDAYLRLKNAYASDSVASYTVLSDEDRTEILEKIEEAYLILSSTMKRREYDIKHGFIKKRIGTPIIRGAVIRRYGAGRHKGVQEKPEDLTEYIDRRREEWSVAEHPEGKSAGQNPEMERRIKEEKAFSGRFLKEIREYRNIALKEVAEATKISVKFLEAIEQENLEVFNAPVYVRGFLAQYARFLELDPVEVCQSYLGRLKGRKEFKEAK